MVHSKLFTSRSHRNWHNDRIARGRLTRALSYTKDANSFGKSINKFRALFSTAGWLPSLRQHGLMFILSALNYNGVPCLKSGNGKAFSSLCAERISSHRQSELFCGYGYVKDYRGRKVLAHSKIGTI